MRVLRGLGGLLVGLVSLLVVALVAARLWLSTPTGSDTVVAWIVEASNSEEFTLGIEGVRVAGVLDLDVAELAIGDADGVWLRASQARLRWRPLRLLLRRIDVTALEVARLELLLLPEASEETEEEPPFDWSTVPAFEVGRLDVGALDLAEPVLGRAVALVGGAQAQHSTDGRWSAELRLDERGADGAHIDVSVQWRVDGESVALSTRILDAPAGLVASQIDADGLVGIDVRIDGAGPLEAWETTLSLAFPSLGDAVEPVLLASVHASIGASSMLDFEGTLAPAGLPSVVLPDELTGQILEFGGKLTVDAEQHWDVERLALAFDTARLAAKGSFSASSGAYDAEAVLTGLDSGGWEELLAPSRIERIGLRASRADGLAAHTSALRIDGLEAAETAFPKIVLTAEAESASDPAFGPGSFRVRGELGVDPMAGDEPLARALAMGATLTAQGVVDPAAGRAHFPSIVLDGQAVTASGALRLEETYEKADLRLRVELPSFARLVAEGLRGTATADLQVTADLAGGTATGDVDLRLQAPRFEVPAAEALLGDAVRLNAKVRADADRVVIEPIELTSKNISLDAQVTLDESYSRVSARFDGGVDTLKPLGRVLGEDVGGRLEVRGEVGGPLEAPTGNVVLSVDDAVFGPRTMERFDLTAGIGGTAKQRPIVATGALRTGPLELTFDSSTSIGATGSVESGRFDLTGTGLQATAAWGKATKAARSLSGTVKVEELSVLSALAGVALEGHIEAKLDMAEDGQTVVHADGGELLLAGVDIGTLRLDLTGRRDQWGFESSATQLGPSAVDLELAGEASVGAKSSTIRLQQVLVSRFERSLLSVAEPLVIVARPGGTDIGPATLTLAEAGRLNLRAALSGADWEADFEADDVPADLLAELAPVPLLGGTLAAQGSAASAGGALSGDFKLAARRLAPPPSDDDEDVEPTWIDVDAEGSLSAGALRGDVVLRAADDAELSLVARGRMDADGARIDRCGLRGRADVGALANLAGVEFDEWGGDLQSDLEIDLAPARPSVVGVVAWSNGRYSSAATGASLTDIEFLLRGVGDALILESFSGDDGKGGTLGGEGRVDLAGWPRVDARASLQTDSLRVMRLDVARVRTTSNLDVDIRVDDGNVEGMVAGRIGIDKAEIQIPRSVTQPIPELRVVDAGSEPTSTQAPDSGGVELGLDIAIESPGEIFVRGRGIDTEWKVDLDVTGTSANPYLEGGIAAVRGEAEVLTRRFEVRRGHVDFVGTDLDPVVDIEASADIDDVEVLVAVGGRASKPTIKFRSDPALPEDEVLSRVLFGSSAAELDPVQTVQLARAAARLSGHIGGGEGVFGGLRRAVGVDRLGVGTGAGGESALRAGKYLGEGVYLNVEQGLTTGTSKVTLEVSVTDHITLQSDVGSDSQGEVGLNWRWDY